MPRIRSPARHSGGRGGIRTHGPVVRDARFRVECLKPDSATLPEVRRKRSTPNVQHPTPNAKGIFTVGDSGQIFQAWSAVTKPPALGSSGVSNSLLGSLRGEKCYNLILDLGSFRTAYCISAERDPQYLVISRNSRFLTGYWSLATPEFKVIRHF
jgi:hypothetical protein